MKRAFIFLLILAGIKSIADNLHTVVETFVTISDVTAWDLFHIGRFTTIFLLCLYICFVPFRNPLVNLLAIILTLDSGFDLFWLIFLGSNPAVEVQSIIYTLGVCYTGLSFWVWKRRMKRHESIQQWGTVYQVKRPAIHLLGMLFERNDIYFSRGLYYTKNDKFVKVRKKKLQHREILVRANEVDIGN